ncbi:oligosaccharide flippase family protein [Calothrix membranacea FACHB-236]|nr:oligosaccharide flippase family protein [Calothrix membranacea FACHB-236]
MPESKPLTLKRNFSWTFMGNAVYAGCQWGMLVVLAKLGSPEMVGLFTLGLAVTAPIIMFTNLQLRAVQATDAKQQYLFSDYLGLRLLGTTLALMIIAAITLVSGYQLQTSLIILLVGLAKAFESISDVYYGLIQQHERMDRMAISLMIKGPLSLLLLGIGVYLSGHLVWGVLGLVLAWAVVLVAYDIPSGAYILASQKFAQHPRWHFKTLSKLVWLALPMGFVMMLISLNTSIPRYFIDGYLGQRELGVFAAISYLMVAGNMVVNALGQSASPRLAKYYVAGNGVAFRTLLLQLVGIAALMGGVGVVIVLLAGQEILALVYRPEYAQYTDVFIWLMIAASIEYIASFLGYGMTAARYFRVQMPLFASVTTASSVICLWLIPLWGLKGAAIALIVAAIVQASFSWGAILHALHKLQSPPVVATQKN